VLNVGDWDGGGNKPRAVRLRRQGRRSRSRLLPLWGSPRLSTTMVFCPRGGREWRRTHGAIPSRLPIRNTLTRRSSTGLFFNSTFQVSLHPTATFFITPREHGAALFGDSSPRNAEGDMTMIGVISTWQRRASTAHARDKVPHPSFKCRRPEPRVARIFFNPARFMALHSCGRPEPGRAASIGEFPACTDAFQTPPRNRSVLHRPRATSDWAQALFEPGQTANRRRSNSWHS